MENKASTSKETPKTEAWNPQLIHRHSTTLTKVVVVVAAAAAAAAARGAE
jgi:hypothetical protein